MNPPEAKKLKKVITSETKKNVEDGKCILNLVESVSKDKIKMDFYCLKFNSNEVREEDFITIMSQKIIRYVLKKKDYEDVQGDPEKFEELHQRAKSKFIKRGKVDGDLGEIILYFLLESKENAIQVLNKISLKTDPNVPFFGLDAIHLSMGDEINLHYGEGKLYKQRTAGVSSSIKSFEDFYDRQGKEQFEMDLISNFIDESKFGKFKDKILDFLNPYSPNKENLRKIHAIFVGYEWNKLLEKSSYDCNIEEKILEEYKKEAQKISQAVEEKVKNSKIKEHLFKFYFIPFSEVDKLREKFKERYS